MSLDLRWNWVLQKQDSYLRFALNAAQDSLAIPRRLKHWQQHSAGDGLCPLGCRITGSILLILVIRIELTSPWEENLTKKHFEEMEKYNKLAIDLWERKHYGLKWTVVPLCVEVGARGAISEQPWNWTCKRLGFSKCSKLRLTQGVHDAAVACSYYIFLCRFLRTWEPQALVDTLERDEC